MDLVPGDLPDGAFFAMAHELAGLDYGDGFDEIAANLGDARPEKTLACGQCKKKFATEGARRDHRRDKHNAARRHPKPNVPL